jgi:hypothetical protein
LRVPIFHGVDFLGCASANITVDVLSRFLDKHRASAHSITLIADRNTGKIIAFPNKQKGVRIENGALKVATLADIDDANVREARRQHIIAGTDSFAFRSTADMFKLLRQSWSIRRPLQTPLGPRLPNRGESGRLSRDCGEHSLSVSLSQFDPSPMSSALFFRAWRHIDAAGATISSLVGVTEIAAMKVHAIRTGSVRIKSAQVEGRGHGLRRRLAIFTDQYWTEWLPTYVWVIEHREGIIVVDAGQGAHLLETGTSLHPYVGWEVTVSFESTVKKKSDRSCGRSVSGRAM